MVLPVTEYEPTPIGVGGESQPTQSNQTASIHGISISLDKSVDLADGYLLIGSMQWSEKDYPANAIRSADYIKVADATGRDISFEPVLGPVGDKPQDEAYRSYWALKVLEKGFVAPLKIRIDSATVNSYAHPYVFQFDPGSNPAPGQSWDIDKNFQVGDIQARILKANLTTINSHDLAFKFDIQAQPNELVDVYINMAVSQCMGGGGSIPTEPYEVIQAYANTCRTDLPAGPLEAQVSGAVIWGPWQVEWTPPETSAAVPTSSPVPLPTHSETCINMDKFKQAVNEKPALPEGFGGRVILFGPYQGNNNVWKTSIVDLDGSNPQVLGDGDGNFSPDGSKVAFSRTLETDQQGIYITDLVSGETTQLPGTGQGDFNPMWSPDGSQISFNRGMGLFELYAINADGTNLRRLTYDRGQEFAVGWMPDGQHLLYTLPGALYQQTDHLVDVQTGKIEYFSNDEFLGMSPDAKYKITAERDPANMDAWVSYFSNVDDSNRWPLVESDTVLQYPIWSPDGEWLLVSLSKLYDSKNTPAFVHLTDCHMIPLPKLNGIVLDWKP
jgi:Tol biopolymer transport system component